MLAGGRSPFLAPDRGPRSFCVPLSARVFFRYAALLVVGAGSLLPTILDPECNTAGGGIEACRLSAPSPSAPPRTAKCWRALITAYPRRPRTGGPGPGVHVLSVSGLIDAAFQVLPGFASTSVERGGLGRIHVPHRLIIIPKVQTCVVFRRDQGEKVPGFARGRSSPTNCQRN